MRHIHTHTTNLTISSTRKNNLSLTLSFHLKCDCAHIIYFISERHKKERNEINMLWYVYKRNKKKNYFFALICHNEREIINLWENLCLTLSLQNKFKKFFNSEIWEICSKFSTRTSNWILSRIFITSLIL